ncbi:thiol reductant ABC exporter subunit CydC [Salisediminibacterium beveridgei]|uniref:Transport ATP-binding protein CydC n=1 Tax=Salisediminibacterium beveridgei TaxID=632773 RepID=A0A1D7QYD5_9BACI|nr:thiol reductant ABC exporter subunit CydC [Salisediminibacterium beveridgei]AOM83988.1 Transport ATP-binding protein CydC [Salisediminibacterium beveridgei]
MKELTIITRLMLEEKKDLIKSVVYGVLAALGAVALFANSGYLISAAAVTNAFYVLTISIALLKFFSVSRALFRYSERLVSHRATFTMLGRFRVYFFERLAPLAPGLSRRFRSGDLLGRIVGDVESLQNYFLRVVYPPAAAMVIFLITIVFTAWFSWIIALLLVFGLLLTSLLIPYIYAMRQKKTANRVRQLRAELSGEVTEMLFGHRDLLLHQKLDDKKDDVLNVSDQVIQAQKKEQLRILENQTVNQGVTFLVSVLILTTGAYLVSTEGLEGIFLAMLVMVSLTVFENAAPMAAVPVYYEDNQTAAGRLKDAVDTDVIPEGERELASAPASVKLRSVGLHFDEESSPALKNVDVTCSPGSTTVVVGPSGSGKSSMLHLLLGMFEAAEGEVLWNGETIHSYRLDSLYENSRIQLQDSHFFAGTIRENLLLANDETADDMLQQVLRDVFLEGLSLDDPVTEQGGNLSGGERQRLAFARLLLRGGRNWFLDEPFSSVDPSMEQVLYRHLRNETAEDTVLIVSHRLTGLEEADQIIVMDHGQVAETGTYQELMNKRGVFYQLKQIEQDVFNAS